MKKIFIILAMALGMVAMQSCKDNAAELIYDVTATAQGEVDFSWVNGGASVKGDAVVFQCNDTTKVKNETVVFLTESAREGAITLADGLASTDVKVAEAAQEVSSLFTVKGVEGKYHLAIVGYVKYGSIIFAIDEEYPKTNAVAGVEEPVEAVADTTVAE